MASADRVFPAGSLLAVADSLLDPTSDASEDLEAALSKNSTELMFSVLSALLSGPSGCCGCCEASLASSAEFWPSCGGRPPKEPSLLFAPVSVVLCVSIASLACARGVQWLSSVLTVDSVEPSDGIGGFTTAPGPTARETSACAAVIRSDAAFARRQR